MNRLYNQFMKDRPTITVQRPQNNKPELLPLNDFQKELLQTGEPGYFLKKARQVGASTVLAAFVSWFIYNNPKKTILYLTHRHQMGKDFIHKVQRDWDMYYGAGVVGTFPLEARNQIRCCSLDQLKVTTISHTFELIIIDEISRKEFTRRHTNEILVHANKDTVFLSTTSLP